jgi:hypothetical protein
MRVAVLVSGRVDSAQGRTGLIRNNTRLKEKFPGADFYYGTWNIYKSEFERLFPNQTCEYFEEPVIQYHPYEINKKYHVNEEYSLFIKSKWAKTNRDKLAHSTKQILLHAWLLDRIKNEYDVIVRTRFDAFIHRSADFTSYIADTFKENRANGFSTFDNKQFVSLSARQIPKKSVLGSYNMLCDQLIIHPPSFITKKQVDRLNEEKILHPAELGWAQVLSYPYRLNHRSFLGWVVNDRNILDVFLKEEDR